MDPEEQPIDMPKTLPKEAIGEDEHKRPQPADDPIRPVDSQDQFRVLRHTIDRLEKDNTARGDLKILSRTLRELRYAFTVFRPYRRRRKVTIFRISSDITRASGVSSRR